MNDRFSAGFHHVRGVIQAAVLMSCAIFFLCGTSASVSLANSASETNSAPPQWPDLTSPLSKTAAKSSSGDSALVIGIENYAFVDDIQGARKNAEDWWLYFRRKNGIPRDGARMLRDREGTREKMLREARITANKVSDGGTIWFVFIGHGVASKSGEEGMLVGADAQGEADSLDARSVRQSEIEAIFLASKAAKIMMITDSCFSGRTADGSALAPGLQALVRKSQAEAEPRIIRMSAGKSDQFAGKLPSGDRPAFSYLLLGALTGWGDADNNGVVTAKEAVDYAADVLDVLERTRRQTPELIASSSDRYYPLSEAAGERGPDIDLMLLGLRAVGEAENESESLPAGKSASSDPQQQVSSPEPASAASESGPDRGKSYRSAVSADASPDSGDMASYRSPPPSLPPQPHHTPGDSGYTASISVLPQRPVSGRRGEVPGMTFIRIPGGSFGLVSGGGQPVFLRSFEMSKTPVTVDAFRLCVAAGACTPDHFQRYDAKNKVNLRNFCNLDRGLSWDKHPMNCVDHEGAEQFCRWIGGRLPTEAEWRYAAGHNGVRFVQSDFPWRQDNKRGAACQQSNSASISMRGRLSYCFGKKAVRAIRIGRRGPYLPPENAGTSSVGLYSPLRDSKLGLTDLTGNVNEWTAAPPDVRFSCPGSSGAACFPVKGGGWRWQLQTLDDRVGGGTVSNLITGNAIEPDIGFRCIREN